jgi:RNA polymerase sigma factor (sigma-70 family)
MAFAMESAAGGPANELALVARATVEPAAFAAIYDHYFPRIYTYVSYRVRDASTADDLTATIFERALAKIGTYRPDGAPFAVWLFAIARNAVNDHLRAQARQRWLSLDAIHDWVSGERPPEEVVIAGEARDALLAAVARLSERERDLLALKFGAQLTNRRIAALTGLSESNVGVILYRAVARLRADLNREG